MKSGFSLSRAVWLGCSAAVLLAGNLFAQGPEVRVELTGKRVVLQDGKESFVPADKAGPGDVLQYEAVYKNSGKAAAKNLAATVPIPQGMSLQADSAKPAGAEASLDGKNFSAIPLMRDVKTENGTIEKQPVPLNEYRALRWNVPELAPDATASVSLRAQILTNAPKN